MAFQAKGAGKLARTVDVKGEKLKKIAELLGVKDLTHLQSAKVEFFEADDKAKPGAGGKGTK